MSSAVTMAINSLQQLAQVPLEVLDKIIALMMPEFAPPGVPHSTRTLCDAYFRLSCCTVPVATATAMYTTLKWDCSCTAWWVCVSSFFRLVTLSHKTDTVLLTVINPWFCLWVILSGPWALVFRCSRFRYHIDTDMLLQTSSKVFIWHPNLWYRLVST